MFKRGNGQLWYGGNEFPGFLFKKVGGAGCNKSTKMGAGGNTTCNQPTVLWNKYVPGAGVGASPTAVRRLKTIRATSCSQCDFTFIKPPTKMHYSEVSREIQSNHQKN